jgi:hypothetical protein
MAKRPDFDEITRLRYEYAFGIDTRDYGLLRSIFTERIRMDFSSYNGRPATSIAADDWVAGCAVLFDGLDATQHSMTNPLVDVAEGGRRATQRMAMQAAHFLDGTEFTIGGWYQDSLVRTDEGWRIAEVLLNVTWRRGDESIMAAAVERSSKKG